MPLSKGALWSHLRTSKPRVLVFISSFHQSNRDAASFPAPSARYLEPIAGWPCMSARFLDQLQLLLLHVSAFSGSMSQITQVKQAFGVLVLSGASCWTLCLVAASKRFVLSFLFYSSERSRLSWWLCELLFTARSSREATRLPWKTFFSGDSLPGVQTTPI